MSFKLNSSNPVAIIGVAFRFPGDLANEVDFWDALEKKSDLVTQIPSDRWATVELQHGKRTEPGRSVTFSAGVLSRVDEFDANFFGISPREAAWLDPQQRLLLELSWEAMENAGIPPSRLSGSDCAVYIGISSLDYGTRGLDDLAAMSAHSMTGNTLSVAANRISYVFDLHGPSLAVDTACSSSLVALHHACQALQTGEASTALVGGVSLLLHPYPFVGFTKASMLSADGRCKTFDAAGNGYVRAEGGAVLLLKPLDRAMADGDDIQAVILATGVNADGARKTGITIPSRDGQVELMRTVLARAGLHAQDIDFIEAHGTGTAVGDPVECGAIGEVYGHGREKPLPLGSVKANLGHMEAASGMAGLVKTVIALKRRVLPPQIHLKSPNPNIDFARFNIEPVLELKELTKDGPLVAGVNSFGFGGANAHVLVQEWRAEKRDLPQVPTKSPPLFLSARSDDALRALSQRYADFLSGQMDNYYDIAYGAAFRRDRLEKRLAVWRDSPQEISRFLVAYSQGHYPPEVIVEDDLGDSGSVAFVYSGNGAQWIGMGRRLFDESARFAELMRELDSRIYPVAGFSVLSELMAEGESSRLDDTVIAQILLFAMQVALTQLLWEKGVSATVVLGHSVGEVAAAWACGALNLDVAIRVIVARSRAQGATRGTGRMAAVGLSPQVAQSLLDEMGADAVIAGVNSPNNVTLSGSLTDLQRLEALLNSKGVFFRLLDLDYAFHSDRMEPIREALISDLSSLEPNPETTTKFISTVTGSLLKGEDLGASYWWRNVREPVQFAEAVSNATKLGCRIFIEIGPHAILQRYIGECLSSAGIKGRVLPTLKKENDGCLALSETILRTHLLVPRPKYEAFFPVPGRFVRLPNYPWQRERFWHPRTSESLLAIDRRRVHPLLGWRIPEADHSWENVLDSHIIPWLADHKVGEAMVFPGAAYVEMALAAARDWIGDGHQVIEELDIVTPMVFDGEHARRLRFDLNPRDGGFTIKSRQRLSQDAWTLHAAGRILQPGAAKAGAFIPPTSSGSRIDRMTHYGLATQLGLEYGSSFQGLEEIEIEEDRLTGRLGQGVVLDASGYLFHPAHLDLCYQSLIAFFREAIEAGQGVALLPVKMGRIDLYRKGHPHSFRARLVRRSARSVQAEFEWFDAEEQLLARLSGCRFRAAPLVAKEEEKISRWHMIPWLNPHPADVLASEWPSVEEIIALLEEPLAPERQAWFKEALPLMEALVVSFAFKAARQLALSKEGGLERLVHSEDPYARWLTSLLREEGLLVEQDGRVSLVSETDLPPAEEIWRLLLREHPQTLPQLVLLGRVGHHLEELLKHPGERETFLASLAHVPAAETLYEDAPAYAGIRETVGHVLSLLAERLPVHRRLRVLEISAGASELPRVLLDCLPPDKLDYVLAVPESVMERAEGEYASSSSMIIARYDAHDLQVTADQPLPEHFDVIVVRHVLHRATHLKGALSQLRAKLVIGGCLLIAERYPDWSADFLYGLSAHWWRDCLTDDKPVSSLMPPQAWLEALAAEGFTETQSFEEPAADGLAEGAYLLLAKCAGEGSIARPVIQRMNWLILVDEASGELAQQLEARLGAVGQSVITATATPSTLAGFQHVIDMRGWQDVAEVASSRLASALALVQAAGTASVVPRLWWITRGGGLCVDYPGGVAPNPVQTALWGFVRVVMNELPTSGSTLIDLADDLPSSQWGAWLENELLQPDGATEILLTRKGRYIPLLREEQKRGHVSAAEGFRLDFHLPGKLRNLRWLPSTVRTLGEGEVEVAVQAAGLNFRDVMYLMGFLPDEAVENGFAGASLGLEFSGVISRIGRGVSRFKPGDRVMGFGASCFASHVVTRVDAIAKIPETWTFEAAATVPTVFLTAYYALKHLAQLQEGERVLIHGAAGGVGIAAIQIAKYLGAEVFATAGSVEKRDFVALLGADRVLDSRSLAFADEILLATHGEGVDVVLNSLAGEAMRRSIAVLKPFGRFLELGKRDFFENTPVGLRPFRQNISYFGIDADQLLISRPKLAEQLFGEVMTLFREGVLAPLPYRLFPAERVVDAFRVMQQSRHIGKVVVSLADAHPTVEHPFEQASRLRLASDSSWLVTGGLSGFGLESARWLASRGVGHLVLVGRRGLETPGAKEAIAELESQGAKVEVAACDITDARAVHELVSHIRKTCPPLKGVLHAAASFDDALLHNLDARRMNTVLSPKLMGAWNLHQATLDAPLDYFVLYSSVTTAIGNPGQANYVAANAGLEGLAALRRSLGLPVACIGWGPIGDAGYLVRNVAVKDSLAQRLGKAPLTAEKALDELDRVLRENETVFLVNFDWNVLARVLPSSTSHRFNLMNRHLKNVGPSEDDADIRSLIVGKTPEEIATIVQDLVLQEVAQILSISPERIDPKRSLHDFGLDSLMAVELALGLEQRLGIQLPVMMLNESPTVEKVSQRIVDKLTGGAGDEEIQAHNGVATMLARQHGEALASEELQKLVEAARASVGLGDR